MKSGAPTGVDVPAGVPAADHAGIASKAAGEAHFVEMSSNAGGADLVEMPSNAAGIKHKATGKTSRIPIKVVATEPLRKPPWIRVRVPSSPRFFEIKRILREHRPDLRVKIVATAPSGLCVVRGLDPSSRVLAERLDEIVERYRDLEYPVSALQTPDGFELVPPNDAGLREALQ